MIRSIIYLLVLSGVIWSGHSLYKSSLFFLDKINYSYISQGEEKNSGVYIDSLKPHVEEKLESYKGQSLWKVDIFKIENDLRTFSWIEDVAISRHFPNSLLIQIKPKKVLANILKTPSKVQPIAYDSTILKDAEITQAPLAPVLTGNAFLHDSNLRERALNLLRELPQKGSFSYEQVSEVYPFRNDEFQILLKNSNALVLINSENVPLKAARISRVIDYMSPQEMKGRVIDSNFSKKVLVRLRNHR